MTELMRRRRALMAQTQARLPSAYQEVEWIQSSGSQKIYTDYEPTYSDLQSLTLTAIFSTVSSTTSKTAIVTGFSDWGGQWIGLMTNSRIGLGANISFSSVTPTAKNEFVMTWDANNGYAKYGNTTISRNMTDARQLKYTVFDVYVPYATGSFASSARFYYSKIVKNGITMIELIPCYRKSDSVIGLYDLANNKFYTNAGTGTFTKGSDVT